MFVQFPSQDIEKKSKAIGVVFGPQGNVEAGFVYFCMSCTKECCYDCSVQKRIKVMQKTKDDSFKHNFFIESLGFSLHAP